MSFLNLRQRQTLALVCQTLVPRLAAEAGEDEKLFAASASDTRLAEQFETAVEEITDEDGRARLRRGLALLESRLANGLLAGHFRSLSAADQESRAAILAAWETSRVAAARMAFVGLKRLALFLHYSESENGDPNPVWPACDYRPAEAGLKSCASPTDALKMLALGGQTSLTADVLVIGSGAGGGVVAAELAAAGRDVLVVDKGDYFADVEFPTSERLGMSRLYENHGSLATSDLGMVVLAGSTVGGGTVVNWMTSLPPPDYVLEEWARDFGFQGALSAELQQSLAVVSRRLNVNTDESQPNPQNALLERGCLALGYRVATIPRNVRACRECGFCCFGCRHDAKQDARRAYLQDAQQSGARILPRAQVQRVLHWAGQVTGAVLHAHDENDAQREITVRAKTIVCAAGSIHTPAILMRSGLASAHLGRNLHLHPTTAIYSRFEEPVHSWLGVPQSRYCDQFANLDGLGHGARLETAPAHPGLWALSLPWQSARQHKQRMQELGHLANIIVLTRDRYSGRVEVDRAGKPRLHYRVHPYDAGHMRAGIAAALRIHRAAGAQEIHGPHLPPQVFRGGSAADFERFLLEVSRRPFAPNRFGLFSAHQLSSCRLAGSFKHGVVNPSGETYEVRNLFVADGSILPSACGVNPMLTIMGLAHYLAQQIKSNA